MDRLQAFLQSSLEVWEKSDQVKEFGNWPDGQYEFQISGGEIYESKEEEDKWLARVEFLCRSGKAKEGEILHQWYNIGADYPLKRLKNLMASLGITPPTKEERMKLPGVFDDLLKLAPKFTGKLTTRKNKKGDRDFQNLDVVGGDGVEVPTSVPTEVEESYVIGDRVSVEFDGEAWEGKLIGVKDGQWETKFDRDGTVELVDTDDLTMLPPEEKKKKGKTNRKNRKAEVDVSKEASAEDTY